MLYILVFEVFKIFVRCLVRDGLVRDWGPVTELLTEPAMILQNVSVFLTAGSGQTNSDFILKQSSHQKECLESVCIVKSVSIKVSLLCVVFLEIVWRLNCGLY